MSDELKVDPVALHNGSNDMLDSVSEAANEDPDKLRRLPRCGRQDNEIQAEGDERD